MALFDCVLENSVLTEGALSASSMKVQLTSILLKIAGGNTDMASAKDIERAIGIIANNDSDIEKYMQNNTFGELINDSNRLEHILKHKGIL